MGDIIVDINGEEYIKLEGLITLVLDYLVDGTTAKYIDNHSNQLADEVCEFLKENGREELAVAFRKMYLIRRFPGLFGK